MTLSDNRGEPEGQSQLINHFSERWVLVFCFFLCIAFQAEAEKLTAHRPVQDHGSGWSALWDTDNSDFWDRGKPSAALIDIIEQQQGLFQPLEADGQRKKVLVPGCGRGYDVVMLALHGFDAYGLEISATGVAAAQKYASTELQKPQEYNFGGKNYASTAPGSVTFIEGDFFNSDWEEKVLKNGEPRFDLVYDYTFLCALHPDQRQHWAARMRDLLHHDGLLVCLEFPMYKDPALPGPPWGLNGVHWDLLARGGDGVANIDTAPETTAADQISGQFKRALYVKPPRSYENGKGTDMLSVYVRK